MPPAARPAHHTGATWLSAALGLGLLLSAEAGTAADADPDTVVRHLTARLAASPDDATLYVARARALIELHEFARAIADLDRALALDATLDEAWFWRGMARGRLGQVAAGIADLSVFLARNPESSLAYTKRGVRYLWLGDLERAFADLQHAIALDPENAEAHDDLGVIYARRGELTRAIHHFRQTIRLDPQYQKGFHNLAMALLISGDAEAALASVDEALRLAPKNRNTVLLKGAILEQLGATEEAGALYEFAEQLDEGNWTERLDVQ